MPPTMAEDGYMPPLFTRKHLRFGTPWIAILVSSGCYAMLTLKSLTQLITVYNWLRIATSIMTVLPVWKLRKSILISRGHFAFPGEVQGLCMWWSPRSQSGAWPCSAVTALPCAGDR
jgi:amino acid transporter